MRYRPPQMRSPRKKVAVFYRSMRLSLPLSPVCLPLYRSGRPATLTPLLLQPRRRRHFQRAKSPSHGAWVCPLGGIDCTTWYWRGRLATMPTSSFTSTSCRRKLIALGLNHNGHDPHKAARQVHASKGLPFLLPRTLP